MDQFNPVGWFEMYVQDIDRAQKFYEEVLNIQLSSIEGSPEVKMKAFTGTSAMDKPGCTGSLVKMDGVKSGGNSVLVYFITEDCAVEQGRVEAAGGKIMKPKMSIGEHGFISICTDTEGNAFGLHSMK
jgi:predicted enzyme related to lactoylglutathione lyase